MALVAIFVATFIVGCSKNSPQQILESKFMGYACEDENDTVALKNMPKSISGYNTIEDADSETIRCMRVELSKVKSWANAIAMDNQTNYCSKASYLKWIDYFSKKLDQREREVTQNKPHELDDSEKEARDRQRKLTAYMMTHDVPKPPVIDGCDRLEAR